MSWFEHGGQRIYYEESGSGEPVLLMPGWAGTIDELGALREALTPRYRVIAADLPGSGKSEPQPRTYAPGFYQDDAPVWIALLEGLEASPAHLMGFSDGGEYALLVASLRPSIARSVVTWGAAGQLPNAPELAAAFGSVVDDPPPPMREFSAYMKSTYGEANARVMVQSFGATLRGIMEAGGDISRSRVQEISCPALLITGEHDGFAPPALVADTAGAIAGGEYVEASGASHAVHREQPEWLAETVTGWLARR